MNREPGLDSHNAGSTEPGADTNDTAEPTAHQAGASPNRSSSEVFTQKDELLREVLGATSSLDARLLQLSELVQGRLAYDKAKEEAFDRLYGELEHLKSNAAFEQLRPLYLDLILLFDRIENICQSASGDSNALSLFRSLNDELVEILYRREIEVIQSVSVVFDPSNQRAIGVEPTPAEGESGRVARVVRRGFRYRNRLIRAEEVIVKKYAANSA